MDIEIAALIVKGGKEGPTAPLVPLSHPVADFGPRSGSRKTDRTLLDTVEIIPATYPSSATIEAFCQVSEDVAQGSATWR